MFDGMKDLWDVGEKPMLVMLRTWVGSTWAHPAPGTHPGGRSQLQEPILEVIPKVRRFAASCCLPPVAPMKAHGSQSVEDAH